jgi:hypothetical protein
MDDAAIPGWSLHSKKQSNPRHKDLDLDPTNQKVPDLGGFGFTKLLLKAGKICSVFSRFRADGDH